MNDVYRQELMDIFKDPSHRGKLTKSTVAASRNNPLCGDKLTLYLNIKENKIEDVGFEANACAVSVISSEFLAEALIGKTIQEAKKLSQADLLKMMKLNLTTSRVKCATLALSALHEALQKYEKDVKEK